MATYYIKPSGNDASNGLTPATAWATIGKVFAASSVVTGGDTVYIAPGAYRELVTAAQTAWTSTVNIIGDPTASFVSWGGIQPGKVRFTSLLSGDTANASSSVMFTASSRGYMAWQNINFEGLLNITSSGNTSFTKCAFVWATNTTVSNTPIVTMSFGTTSNYTFSKCIFASHATNNNGGLWITIDNGTDHNCNINDCLFSQGGFRIYGGVSTVANNINIFNCSFTGGSGGFYGIGTGNGSRIATFTNCYFLGCGQAAQATGTANILVQYSRAILCAIFTTNVSQSNNAVAGAIGVDIGENILFGLTAQPYLSSLQGYPNIAFGISSGAPATDLYGITWTGATPDAGGITYQSLQLAGQYYPTERNASTITIAPGSTSQSIELYLGATGLTASTSGLSAYYNRTRTADVQIPLVARVIDGSNPSGVWTAGGFAEVNASTMPGVYRLDLPDAAVAAGADDVTVVVRGASGTNGAVMTIKLSSGGLTAAQTAQAVLDAVASTHNNIGSIGAFIQDKTGYSLSTSQTFNTSGSVGSVAGNVTGNVVGTVGGVAGNITGNLSGSVGTVANPDNIIDGVWDEQRVGHTASGSFGEKLQTNAMADEMLARDLGSGLNAGTAEERTVRSALRALRNKVNVGSSQMVVKKEDDTTDAWTASVTTTAVSSNVSGIDPN